MIPCSVVEVSIWTLLCYIFYELQSFEFGNILVQVLFRGLNKIVRIDRVFLVAKR